jgi:hypothetical protein
MDGIPCGAIFGEQAEVPAVGRHFGLDPESSSWTSMRNRAELDTRFRGYDGLMRPFEKGTQARYADVPIRVAQI